MAPATDKRRRPQEDARKPKRKIRVKRQKNYHSSSEDEDDGPPVVSDAPVKKAVEGKPPPKSILKQVRKGSPPAQNGADMASGDESEEEDEDGVDVDETELNTALNAAPTQKDESDADSDSVSGEDEQDERVAQDAPSTEDSASDSETSLTSSQPSGTKKKSTSKRSDPSAFSTSISRILDTKLTTSKRADPVLSRSSTAQEANASLSDARLEHAAKQQLKTEKRAALEKGRVKDVLGLEDEGVETGRVQEEEKRLKKVAQRGVVRLFNAVRAAQVRAEQGEEFVKGEGVVGKGQREKRVGEMSKEGFLELISRGGGEKAGA